MKLFHTLLVYSLAGALMILSAPAGRADPEKPGHVVFYIQATHVDHSKDAPVDSDEPDSEALNDFHYHMGGAMAWMKGRNLPHSIQEAPGFSVSIAGRTAAVPAAALQGLRFGVVFVRPDGAFTVCPGVCGTDVDLIMQIGSFFGCPFENGFPNC